MNHAAEGPTTLFFFSRGKGRGHAIPDAAIAEALMKLEPGLDIVFVSYSVGAATLTDLGCKVHDLLLPEDNPLWDTVVELVRLFKERQPSFVVSHEEFAAIPLANAFQVPSIFLTDWFWNAADLSMQALVSAEEILFLDDAGYYDEPAYLKGKVKYLGTTFRRLETDKTDRQRRRAELGISADSTVILVAPGGAEFHSEERAPLFDVLVGAFHALPIANKRLLWVVGSPDHDVLAKKAHGQGEIVILPPHLGFTSTLLSSDLVITKGNRTPILECEALGIPSISLSFGMNPIDEYRTARVPSNIALRVRGIDQVILRDYLLKALAVPRRVAGCNGIDTSRAREMCAERIQFHLSRFGLARTSG